MFDVAIPEHATQVTLGCIGEGLTQHEAIETLRGKRESLTFWMREATDVREAMESTAQSKELTETQMQEWETRGWIDKRVRAMLGDGEQLGAVIEALARRGAAARSRLQRIREVPFES